MNRKTMDQAAIEQASPKASQGGPGWGEVASRAAALGKGLMRALVLVPVGCGVMMWAGLWWWNSEPDPEPGYQPLTVQHAQTPAPQWTPSVDCPIGQQVIEIYDANGHDISCGLAW